MIPRRRSGQDKDWVWILFLNDRWKQSCQLCWIYRFRRLGARIRGIGGAQFDASRARKISRLTWQAERSIARRGNNDIKSVHTYRNFALSRSNNAARRFSGTAVNRVVDQGLARSGDPFLSNTIIRQRTFGRNAKGNPIHPDYRIAIDKQTVIDVATAREAGKALKYPVGNVIEPYTGTVRYPGEFCGSVGSGTGGCPRTSGPARHPRSASYCRCC